jgi:hypothetical protein
MKTQFKDIKIIKVSPEGGGGTGKTPPSIGKPENIIELPPDEPTPPDPSEIEQGEDIFKEVKDYDPKKGKGTFNPGEILKPGELGDTGDDSGAGTKNPTIQDIENYWDSAVRTAGGNSNPPKSIKRALERLKRPVIDWRSVLDRYIDEAISKSKYELPSRRFLAQGEAQYGYKNYKDNFESVVVAIDTSGSINRDMIEQFLSETLAISEAYDPKKTVIIYCSDDIDNVDILESGEKPDLSKIATTIGNYRGFSPPFEWVEKNMLNNGETPSVMIYFTDGIADFPSENQYNIDTYSDRCIWVFLSFDGEPFEGQQPFGERIDIALANKEVKRI